MNPSGMMGGELNRAIDWLGIFSRKQNYRKEGGAGFWLTTLFVRLPHHPEQAWHYGRPNNAAPEIDAL